jgi:hypothetical protein
MITSRLLGTPVLAVALLALVSVTALVLPV